VKRARLIAPEKIVIEDVPIPMPGPGEVRVAIRACGVCGSDVHAYHGRHPFISCPVVPGHEFSGTIDALGQGVTGWMVGQRVTVEPSLVCGVCENCRSGRYNICDALRVIGCQSDGAMAEYLVVPAAKLIPLPDSLDFESAALIEPTAVGVHAVRRLELPSILRLLVVGAGTIGLQTMQSARALGIPEVIVTDLSDARLERARALGATRVVNVGNVALTDWMLCQYGRANPMDAAIECVGAGAAAINSAIKTVKKGRRIVVAGVWGSPPTVNMGLIQDHELELVGTLMYTCDDFLTARDLIAAGRIQIKPLITARYSLAEAAQAFTAASSNPETTLKVLIIV